MYVPLPIFGGDSAWVHNYYICTDTEARIPWHAELPKLGADNVVEMRDPRWKKSRWTEACTMRCVCM